MWLLILIGFIVTISIRFYTNSVLFLTRILGFSEFLGGAIILCFGNSLNKLLFTVTKAKNDTELFYNEMLGTTIFLLTFTVGLIIIQSPLQLIDAQFITISIFILVTLAVITSIVYDSAINLYEVLLLLSLFILFLSITIIVHRKMKIIYKRRLKLSDDIQNELVQDEMMTINTEVVQLKRISCDSDVERQEVSKEKLSGWRIFIRYMTPFCMKRYRNSGKAMKGLLIVQTPFYLILLLLIPKVDYVASKRNWSKFNYIFVLLVYPVVASFSLDGTCFKERQSKEKNSNRFTFSVGHHCH